MVPSHLNTTWSSPKWVMTGFSSAPIPTKFKQTLEDLRLSFFQTTWQARYDLIWNKVRHNEIKLFITTANKILTRRYKIAQKYMKEDDFKINYGIDIVSTITEDKVQII